MCQIHCIASYLHPWHYDIFQLIYGHNAGTLEATLGPRSWWDTKSSDSCAARNSRRAVVGCSCFGCHSRFLRPLLIYVTWNGWLFKFETSRRGQPWKKEEFEFPTAFQPKQSVLMQFKRWKVSPYAGHAQSLCAWWKMESGYPRPDIAMTQLEGIVSNFPKTSGHGLAARTVGPRPECFTRTKWSPRQTAGQDGESLPSLDHEQ